MHLRVTKPRKKGDTSVRMHSTGSTYREEDGSDEEGISLNAIKSKYKSQAQLGAAKGTYFPTTLFEGKKNILNIFFI